MYTASADFLTKIKSNIRKLSWSGSIVTGGGTTYQFDTDKDSNKGKIVSGSITRSISSQKLNIGTVHSNSITLEVILAGVSRYELYDGVVTISCSLDGASDVIPMGVYKISEADQTADHITIKAYDDMVKFDGVNFNPANHTSIQKPYAWLSQACAACGVTLGNTSAQIQAMVNGTRMTGYADVVADVKTWRDVLSYLAAYLCGFSYIGRDGKLYIGNYGSVSADTIPANFRYSSNLSDFRTTYDGLYATYKEGGVQEYVSNSNSGGLVLDLGVNPFLQFSNSTNRQAALQEIIDAWDGIYYVPYSSDLPLVPIYDPGDVLTFTGNQADVYDYGAITEITYNIGGTMPVKCTGDNPLLADAQDRFTKTLEGISSEYSNGQEIGGKNFWLLKSNIIANNNIGSTKTLIAQIDFDQSTDVQKMGFMFDCDGTLSASAVIKIELTVDDELTWTEEYTDRKLAGKIPFPHNMGQYITGKGSHVAKVYMTVTDSPLTWGELA